MRAETLKQVQTSSQTRRTNNTRQNVSSIKCCLCASKEQTSTALCVICSHFTHETLCMRARKFYCGIQSSLQRPVAGIHSFRQFHSHYKITTEMCTFTTNIQKRLCAKSNRIRLSCISLLLIVIAARSRIKTQRQSERGRAKEMYARK